MTLFEELEWLRAFASFAMIELRAIRRWVEDHPDFAFAPRNMRPIKASSTSFEKLQARWDDFHGPNQQIGSLDWLKLRDTPPLQPPQSEP